MEKGRLEAFSDGVFAIIITIMVLELKTPESAEWQSLRHLTPVFLSYVLSFIYVGIYWSNHHHLFQVLKRVDGRVLWANLHLLFWLSFTPFVTSWAGSQHFQSAPVGLYGVILLMAGVAYFLLVRSLLRLHPGDSALARAIGSDVKGIISVIGYAIGVLCAAFSPLISCLLYIAIAILWIIPDRRIERVLD